MESVGQGIAMRRSARCVTLLAALAVASAAAVAAVSSAAAAPTQVVTAKVGTAAARPLVSAPKVIKIVHRFDASTDGSSADTDLTAAPDGNLYGVTSTAGPTGGGALFRVVPGGGYKTVAGLPPSIGGNVAGRLTVGPNGKLYGTTTGDHPVLFAVTVNGVFTVVDTLPFTAGTYPDRVTFGKHGTIYGVTDGNAGTVYRLTTSGSFSILATLRGGDSGNTPNPLTLSSDGDLYGTASTLGRSHQFHLGSAFAVSPTGALTTIAHFVPTDAVRDVPNGQLVVGPDGALYGTTQKGTVYRLTTSGEKSLVTDLATALASAPTCTAAGAGGAIAGGGLLGVGAHGALYGVLGPCVYSTTTSGHVTLLGQVPGRSGQNTSTLTPVVGRDGNLYGTGIDRLNNNGFVYEVALH